MAVVYLILLAVSFILFPMLKGWWALMMLFMGSFFLYGTHVFLVSTFPTRFVDKQVVAASTGYIDGMGYVGTTLIGIIVPLILGAAKGNWNYVFGFWAILAVITAFFVSGAYIKCQRAG